MKPHSKPLFPERIREPADFAQFVRAMLAPNREPISVPLILAVGVDDDHLLCGFGVHDQAREISELRVEGLLALAAELDAVALLLAQVLPPGLHAPGLRAAREFSTLAEACDRAGLLLVDCVVVAEEKWWSLRTLAP